MESPRYCDKMKRLLLLFLIAVLAFAQTDSFIKAETFQEQLANISADSAILNALPIISIALLISVSVSAVVYGFGKMFSNARMLVFAKDELFHSIVSVILISSIAGIFIFSSQFFAYFTDSTPDNMLRAITYMEELLRMGRQILENLIKYDYIYQFDATWYWGYFAPFVGGETFWDNAYHNVYARQLQILTDLVMMGYVAVGVQLYVLKFINSYAFAVMVPAAILFRTIPIIRPMGNLMLGLVFALYIFLPLAYAIHSPVIDVTPICDDNVEAEVLYECSSPMGWGTIASFLFQATFLPNLALIFFATSLTAMKNVVRVIS
ncbi:hypothetical protein KAW38_03425 [Candidatus Micrarchaeota archaeon]|nr:hypothetical protein [Candidatus Micrarchaeota archaeon]